MKKIMMSAIVGLIMSLGAGGAWANGPYPTAMTDGTYGPVGTPTPSSLSGPGTNQNEFELYQAVNQLLGTSFNNNAQLDSMEVTGNTATWTQGSNGGYAVIGLGAANSNTFEVYNAATPNTLINPLNEAFSGNGATGSGTINSPYVGTGAAFASGTQFGLALNTVGTNNINVPTGTSNITWRSDPTLNSDGMDHLIVYNLSSLNGKQVYITDPNTHQEELVTLQNPYLVGFEDLPLSSNGSGSDLDYNDLEVLVSGASPFSPSPVPEPTTWALLAAGLAGFGLLAFRRRFALNF